MTDGGAVADERVLIVESNPVHRLHATSLMTARGFDVCSAADVVEALSALESERFAMILLDCGLPAFDGFEFAGLIREANLGGAQPRVIGMSPHTDDSTRSRGLAAGMDDVVLQPLCEETLDGLLMHCDIQRPTRDQSNERPHVDPQMLELLAPQPGEAESSAADLDAYRDALAGGAGDIVAHAHSGDLVSVSRIAHRLAGLALQIGANPLAAQLRQIEHAARATDADRVAHVSREMQIELEHVQAALRF